VGGGKLGKNGKEEEKKWVGGRKKESEGKNT